MLLEDQARLSERRAHGCHFGQKRGLIETSSLRMQCRRRLRFAQSFQNRPQQSFEVFAILVPSTMSGFPAGRTGSLATTRLQSGR